MEATERALFESGVRAALCEVDALIYRRHASNVTMDEAWPIAKHRPCAPPRRSFPAPHR